MAETHIVDVQPAEVLNRINVTIRVRHILGPLRWRAHLGMAVLRVGVWLASRILRFSIKVESRG